MGGHLVAGESYDEAFARELAEELNLDSKKIVFEMIGKLTPHDHGTSAFMQVYRILTNEVPSYNQEDFCEFYWLSAQEVLEKIQLGDQSKGDLPKILRHLFL
jgi:isopentenyl-diphosphate delta-isomerase